tara:strand:+ start:112 stop:813 length:702 start_codon:yes stop_codon:yes gene_type:complete
MAPTIISIDGNIGSGKSTIVRYFEKNFEKFCNMKTFHYKICFLQEPVNIWESIKDETGKNAIEKFYENNERYSFAFQMMAYISRLSLLKEALSKDYDIIFTERSIYTDRNIFAKMLYNSKKMDSIEYQIYLKWFDEFINIIENMKTVYIRTTPEICSGRIKKRDRPGENIPIEYLKNCHAYHEDWLNNMENIELGNILIIDGNIETSIETSKEKYTDNKHYNNIMEKVFNFMK